MSASENQRAKAGNQNTEVLYGGGELITRYKPIR